MPSPALGSFLREFSGLMLKDEDEKSRRKREDLLTMREGLFRMLDDPALTDAGRARIGAAINESLGTKGKLKGQNIFNIGKEFASILGTEVPEQRIGEKIPESDYALGGGDFMGDVLAETSPGGAEVTPAFNPYRRSREDMLSEGYDTKLRLLKEQDVLDPRSALEVITGMAQRPAAQARDPLTKAYPEGEGRAKWLLESEAGGTFAEGPPKQEEPSTPIGKYMADRVEFHSRVTGLDPPGAQLAAQRDAAEREERRNVTERLDRELKESLLAMRQASEAGRPIDYRGAGLANSIRQNVEMQAANLVKDHIEQLQNATGPNNQELIEEGNALAADQDAQAELRDKFVNDILVNRGVSGPDLQAILGGVTGEAAAEQTIGTIGRRLLGQ